MVRLLYSIKITFITYLMTDGTYDSSTTFYLMQNFTGQKPAVAFLYLRVID